MQGHAQHFQAHLQLHKGSCNWSIATFCVFAESLNSAGAAHQTALSYRGIGPTTLSTRAIFQHSSLTFQGFIKVAGATLSRPHGVKRLEACERAPRRPLSTRPRASRESGSTCEERGGRFFERHLEGVSSVLRLWKCDTARWPFSVFPFSPVISADADLWQARALGADLRDACNWSIATFCVCAESLN